MKRIPPNVPYALEDSDIVGIGWTIGAPLANINDAEKYVFKFVKNKEVQPMSSRIKFQGEIEIDNLEKNLEIPEDKTSTPVKTTSPKNLKLKRKLSNNVETDNEKGKKCRNNDNIVIDLLSDSDPEVESSKVKIEPISKLEVCSRDQIKLENELEYEAFNIKQEYQGYDDEPIKIESDSDSESENWFLRLSQSSPGKPFLKAPQKDSRQEDTSYSQLDDYVPNLSTMGDLDDEEEFIDDPIRILPPPENVTDSEEFIDDIITVDRRKPSVSDEATVPQVSLDVVDGFSTNQIIPQKDKSSTDNVVLEPNADAVKKIQLIEPQMHKHHGKSRNHEESK